MPGFSTYLIAFVAMALVFVLTGASLHFARYKKRGGCCSEGLGGTGHTKKHGCGSCECEHPE